MWEHAGAIVAASALIFNVITAIVAMLLRQSMLSMKVELGKAISEARAEIDERVDRQARDFGEIATAMRAKIHEVEMWSRDTFVRRDSFHKVSEDLTSSIGKFGDKIEARLERMEGKIDSKQPKAES